MIDITELNRLYKDADEADRSIFAEMRSNILLISGNHYNHRGNPFQRGTLRDSARDSSENQKLRLTKNHLHKVYRHYVANTLAYAPGVTVVPQKEAELQDQKAAELNLAVWQDAKDRYRMHEKVRNWAQNFHGVGEVCTKIFYDPTLGDFKGYKPKMQMDDRGNVIVGMDGQPMPELDESGKPMDDKDSPQFKGAFVFENVFGFNLLRAPGAKSMEESPFLIIRKMVSTKDLKKKFKNDPDKLKMIDTSKDDTYVIFDSQKGSYNKSKDETLIREFYWKPCYEYPKGWFSISTVTGVLIQDELPFGIYPIVWQGCDEYPTHPRAHSIIKQLRPYQAEINRASSAQAQHQISIGDDKILYMAGTKLSPGSLLPGVRGITYQGTPPTVMAGRDGSQYLPYIEAQVAELYQVAEMNEENETMPAQADVYALLFASMKQFRKFAIYGEKFEQFLLDICFIYLELAKEYLPDDELIYAVGKNEQVNIAEFRKTEKLCYQIKLEERNETIETQLGKQLSFNHILQYVGPNLPKEDIGKLIRNMPFGNNEESFKDFTMNYDVVKNDWLALERGEVPIVNEYDDHEYIVQKTTARMREPDFRFLSPQVKVNYTTYKAQHEKFMADQAKSLLDAKNEFIPTGGALIAADLYIPQDDPNKAAKRVRLPYQAVDWLVQKLEAQGMPLNKLEAMNKGVVSDLVGMLPQNKPNPSMAPMGQPPQGVSGSNLGVS